MLLMVASFGVANDKTLSSADPSYYLRRPTWQETLLASREALMTMEAKEAQAAGKAPTPRLGPWFVQSQVLLPEQVAALNQSVPNFEVEKAIADPQSSWVQRLDLREGWTHPLCHGRHVVYLYRSITAPAATTFPVYLDVCGEMTAWLDGKQILAPTRGQIGRDNWSPDPRAKPTPLNLNLTAGKHGLLVRLVLNPGPRPRDDVDPWRKVTLETRRPWGTIFNGHATKVGPAEDYEKLIYGETSQLYFSTSAKLGPPVDTATVAREQLWQLLRRDFADPATRRQIDQERQSGIWRYDWTPGDLRELGYRFALGVATLDERAIAMQMLARVKQPADLQCLRNVFHENRLVTALRALESDPNRRRTLAHQLESLRQAIGDLHKTHGSKYARGQEFLTRMAKLQEIYDKGEAQQNPSMLLWVEKEIAALRGEALLGNPLLNFDKLLLVKRRATQFVPHLPYNWANNSSLPRIGFDNEIAVLSPPAPTGAMATLYKPNGSRMLADVDLHFDGDKMLFSMPGPSHNWEVFEMRADGTGLRQVSKTKDEVDNFDPCYLPDGRILFCSTANFAGVPCVGGRDYVGVIYRMNADGSNVRQLCFEQDQDWCPTVLNDGRVMYTRWEYTDIPHFFSRRLMTMNPDGTRQRSLYGTTSYWPNGVFYARPVPNHPTKVVGVVSGHHVARRSGELVLFDPAKGNQEADGVVQRIPGRGQKVEPVINDRLSAGTWPRFLHPYPLSDKYFLVACQVNEQTPWAIYLVDVFDNMVLLQGDENYDLLEPMPLRQTPRPPAIPEQTDWSRKDAVVDITDVYAGRGLTGVPRGTVKKLRVVAYHYAFRNMSDDSRAIGIHASWDTVKMVLGTVPVHADGSAQFRVPACTPLSIQPLDEQGQALQLMRSWMVAMPGETQSCVGCHADQHRSPPPRQTLGQKHGVAEITPWYGPPRGFSFAREVQPVLDRYCVGCHDGNPRSDGTKTINFAQQKITDPRGFSPAYLELHRYVRRPGAETDIRLLLPAEFHANTAELLQLLDKGHYNVKLDAEARDRLVTWIDLNVPYHGTWQEAQGCDRVGKQGDKRRDLARQYAGLDLDPEVVPPIQPAKIAPLLPPPMARQQVPMRQAAHWPFDAAEAKRRQQTAGQATTQTIDLGNGLKLDMVLIPAGEFVMGDANAITDDQSPRRVKIGKPFWMGKFEVTNEQFTRFDPRHDSRYMQTQGITSDRGYPLNQPKQPVARVSWTQAQAFCAWLSAKTGHKFTLPTEDQWEYACRAGTTTPFYFGAADADFTRWANLADRQMEHHRDYSHNSKNAWYLRDDRFDDGQLVSAPVGLFAANAWGLHDMHGNVWEWTRSEYQPGWRVARGGSWHDRPGRSTATFRVGYPTWQGVFNVGFRVICEP